MGSKRNILDFVIDTIQEIDPSGEKRLYDIFAGSSVVGGAFRNIRPVTSNDIQKYSSVIGKIYLQNYDWSKYNVDVVEQLLSRSLKEAKRVKSSINMPLIDYKSDVDLPNLLKVENQHKSLLNRKYKDFDHLFLTTFSGTYWSIQQCIDIDAIMSVARKSSYPDDTFSNLVLGSLMFSMAYCSQSTGHYAQYRDITEENVDDILIYRKKSIFKLFKQKLNTLIDYYSGENNSVFSHETTNLDYIDSVKLSRQNSIIYADPPYQFVHYSRFYHALETLVKYDYPEVRYKGRYRTDRHQSPFCIRTKVGDAFKVLFAEVAAKKSTLVLSYSDNGMISLEDLLQLSKDIDCAYSTSIKEIDYLHSTMGRQKDKYRSVKEILLIYKPN